MTTRDESTGYGLGQNAATVAPYVPPAVASMRAAGRYLGAHLALMHLTLRRAALQRELNEVDAQIAENRKVVRGEA